MWQCPEISRPLRASFVKNIYKQMPFESGYFPTQYCVRSVRALRALTPLRQGGQESTTAAPIAKFIWKCKPEKAICAPPLTAQKLIYCTCKIVVLVLVAEREGDRVKRGKPSFQRNKEINKYND